MPTWWIWPLEFTPHLEERMEQRGLSEVELRQMLATPSGLVDDHVEGRWVVHCRLRQAAWHVIVEPDDEDEVVVLVTAYRVD